MKWIVSVLFLLGISACASKEATTEDPAKIHSHADHVHGADCGHNTVAHGDHSDYIDAGHQHCPHGDHYDEAAVTGTAPAAATGTCNHKCNHAKHVHGKKCGHKTVKHGNHWDCIHEDHQDCPKAKKS